MDYFNKQVYFWLSIATIFLFISCCSGSKKDKSSNTIEINASELITQKSTHTYLSQIFDNCKYVILEVSDECLIDRVRFLFLTKQYIIVVGRRDCFVFDRNTGKFLRKIGKCGEGPNEYSSYIRHAFIDEANDLIFILSRDYKLLSYNINDASLINIVKNLSRHYQYSFRHLDLIDSIHYIGNIDNSSGNFKDRFVVGTIYGDSIHSFPNHLSFNPKKHPHPETQEPVTYSTSLTSDMHFYRFKNKLYMKELLNDTLFYAKDPYTLIPQVVFDMGKYQFSFELYSDALRLMKEIENYLLTKQVFESDEYLLFSMAYQNKSYGILYCKKTGISCLVDVADETQPFGFQNDIINGLPAFWPKFENNSGEMIACYFPSNLKEFLEENKSADVSKDLKNTIDHLTDDDNPVIVIVK
jgi:hypothetical protein